MNTLNRVESTRGSSARLLLRNRFLVCLILAALPLLGGMNAFSQVRESATAGRTFLWVGGGASGYYIQYGAVKNLGVTAYVDADSVRRFGIEAEGRWLQFHQTNDIHAETYLAGPRYHFNMGRFQPYVKGLGGLGKFNFTNNYAHGSYFVVAGGGGADYRLSSRWSARADFEYQYWPQFTFGAMSSGGVTVGVRYLILR
jgi:opacity protein-like surface antigen